MAHIVLGVSGASGTILAHRALHHLVRSGHRVDLIASSAALLTASLEMGKEFAQLDSFLQGLSEEEAALCRIYRNKDLAAPIASGSCKRDGMLLIPCSMASLAAIAVGLTDNLIRRAAEVNLKMRRRLVLVPRESPLTEVHLENMLRIVRMGGVVLPPMPAWYLKPSSLKEVEETIVARTFDLLGLDAPFSKRWEGRP